MDPAYPGCHKSGSAGFRRGNTELHTYCVVMVFETRTMPASHGSYLSEHGLHSERLIDIRIPRSVYYYFGQNSALWGSSRGFLGDLIHTILTILQISILWMLVL